MFFFVFNAPCTLDLTLNAQCIGLRGGWGYLFLYTFVNRVTRGKFFFGRMIDFCLQEAYQKLHTNTLSIQIFKMKQLLQLTYI